MKLYLASLILALLAACGGGDPEDEPLEEPTTTKPHPVAPPPGK